MQQISDALPDCMMPDGAQPCLGYQAMVERQYEMRSLIYRQKRLLDSLGDRLDLLLGKCEMPRTMPAGWTEREFELVSDWIEPARREIQTLREIAHEAASPL